MADHSTTYFYHLTQTWAKGKLSVNQSPATYVGVTYVVYKFDINWLTLCLVPLREKHMMFGQQGCSGVYLLVETTVRVKPNRYSIESELTLSSQSPSQHQSLGLQARTATYHAVVTYESQYINWSSTRLSALKDAKSMPWSLWTLASK